MTRPTPLMSTIVRVLECIGCFKIWNWMDANTPRHCPFCGVAMIPEEKHKYVAKVPARG